MLRCPYCAFDIPVYQAVCPRCGNALPVAAPGFVAPAAIAPQPVGPTQVVVPGKEAIHHWIWIGNLITLVAAGALFYFYTYRQHNLGLTLAGVLLIVLASISLALSRFGRHWKRASCLVKALILPGVLAGIIVALIALLESLSDSSNGHGDGGHGGTGHDGDIPDTDGGEASGRRAAPLHFKTCPYCGRPMPAEARFCFSCGRPS